MRRALQFFCRTPDPSAAITRLMSLEEAGGTHNWGLASIHSFAGKLSSGRSTSTTESGLDKRAIASTSSRAGEIAMRVPPASKTVPSSGSELFVEVAISKRSWPIFHCVPRLRSGRYVNQEDLVILSPSLGKRGGIAFSAYASIFFSSSSEAHVVNPHISFRSSDD